VTTKKITAKLHHINTWKHTKKQQGQVNQMSVLSITFSVHTHKSQLNIQEYRWTRLAFVLANSSIMLLKSNKIESILFYTQ